MGRRSTSTGGMQTSGAGGSPICPKCGKASPVMKDFGNIIAYMHYTKTDVLWHVQNRRTGEWETKKWEEENNG